LTWMTKPLEEGIEIAGEIILNLFASTTGTDADWIVKLIDVYPEDSSDLIMANYQLMIADEVIRSKFKDSFSEPKPLVPDEINHFKISLGTRAHKFKKGHRIMVKIHSTWFPLIDRNPQNFINIPTATKNDYAVATQSIFLSKSKATYIELPVIQKKENNDE